jgi:hypothetical protein
MTAINFTMPVEQEERYENQKSTYQPSVSIYKPLPNKTGQRFVNEVFIPLYDPSMWDLFNRSSEEREALGLHDHNPLSPVGSEAPLYTFYFKVFVHSVKDFVREDGSSGFAQLICPNHFNSYLTKAMGRRPFFKSDKCAICEAANKAWGDYNERWKEIEQERGIKKSEISSDGRREIGEKDPVLKEAYGRAKSFGVQEKTILNVFDYGKFSGTRPKDVEEEALTYQMYSAPKKVFEDLKNQWAEDSKDGNLHFFSFENPLGLQVVKIIKSTEECKGDTLWGTKYSVMKGSVVKLDDAWVNYLTSISSMIDPTELLHVVSYENMAMYGNGASETSYNKPAQDPPQTTQAPPQVSQAPVVPPQVPAQVVPPQTTQAPVVPAQVPPQTPVVPAQAPPQVPPQVPAQVPPTVPGAPPAAPQTAVPVVPTSEPAAPAQALPQVPGVPVQTPPVVPPTPERTPPQVPSGQDFNW